MGDFVQQSIVKTTARELASPIANVTTFNTLVAGVISGNPWNCTAYEVGGIAQAPVTKTREGYTARIEYEDDEARVVGYLNAHAASVAGFNRRHRDPRRHRPYHPDGRRCRPRRR
jgi:hypothetical protein